MVQSMLHPGMSPLPTITVLFGWWGGTWCTGSKQALQELVEELDVHEVWVGCSKHYG